MFTVSALRVRHIKDLKDLRFIARRATIDMQDLKDLKRFSHGCARGGNPLACACGRRGSPRYGLQGCLRFTVGRGPVPRRASVEETALVGVLFSRMSSDRGGQAPALRTNRANRENLANPAPLLLIVKIV